MSQAPVIALSQPEALPQIWDVEPLWLKREDLDHLLAWASAQHASDVVLQADEAVVARIYGEWRPITVRAIAYAEISQLLNETYMASAEARLAGREALDFLYEVKLDRVTRIGFRVNATRGILPDGGGDGASVTYRTLPHLPPSLEELEAEPPLFETCDQLAGLVLVSGVTGSGKSTLLAGMLRHILANPPGRHVLTYEAPVEFILGRIPNRVGVVEQTEIPRHLEDFPAAVRNALRRAPDVILIGESRDRETIEGAITAAETGHLTYTTVHAGGVASTIARMLDPFPHDARAAVAAKLINQLRLIVYQRLVPSTDGKRVALREFLRFTPELRRELLAVPHGAQLTKELQDLLHAGGNDAQALVSDATIKHAEGRISDLELARLRAEFGAGT